MSSSSDQNHDPLEKARRALADTVEREVGVYGAGDGTHELDPKIKAALIRVPRERFVPEHLEDRAFDNRPLPIGHDQTISQPLVVALMTQHLRLSPDSRVLEVGTGSGYQAAMLAEFAKEVVTLEIVEELAEQARKRLEAAGYHNVVCRTGDGATGAPDLAPFDGILVTAAAKDVPAALVEQLAPGGRMVIPVGRMPVGQELLLIDKDQDGKVHERTLFPVAFVPLTGDR